MIERIETYNKVQKHLCGVEFDEQLFGEEQFTLHSEDGTEVGAVTSSVTL